MQKEQLPVSFQFPENCLLDDVFAVLGGEGLDRKPRLWRRVHGAQISYAGKGLVQRSGDGRCAQRQHIHLPAQLDQPFFVGHAKALLFIHHSQAQVLETNVLLQQPVGADHNIYVAGLEARNHFFLFLGRSEAAEDLHPDRVGAETLAERGVVLLSKDGGRHQDPNLKPIINCLERRPQGHFGFSIANVAADQAVHGLGLFHVGFDLVDGPGLVRGLFEGKCVFQLLLPGGVGAEVVTLCGLASGMEFQQVLGQFPGCALDLFFDPSPFCRVEPGQRWGLVLSADVGRDSVQVVCGHVQLVFVGVLQDQVLFVLIGPGCQVVPQARRPGEPGDPVVHVDHEAARD